MAAQLVFVCGAAIATLQSQTLFAGLAGATVGISDGISMLTTASVAGSALNNVRAGAMGVLARERKKSVRGW